MNVRTRSAALLGAALTTLIAVSAASAAPMTFEAALKLADQTAPALAAKAADVRAAQSAAISAGRLPDPKISVQAMDFPISGPLAGRPDLDNFSMVTLGVSQDVPSAARRRSDRAVAATVISEAEAQRLLAQRRVRIATGLAWIDLYYAERRLAALDEVDRALAPMRRSAPAQLASGAQRPSQTLEPDQLTAALADRRADLVAAVAMARADLGRWIDGAQAVEPAGDPPGEVLDPAALRASLDALPELRLKAAAIEHADAQAAVAKAAKQPDWGVDVGYSHRDPRFGDYLSAKLTMSLPIFGSTRQNPQIAARLEDVNSAVAEQRQTRRDLEAALASALADHVMHHERLEQARGTLVPLADRRARLEVASYAAGTASLADVLSAALGLAEAKVDLIGREADVTRDGARIALTYGSNPQ